MSSCVRGWGIRQMTALETQPAEGDPPTNHADPASPGTEVGRW